MQSAAATIGEISQPVAGSTARGIVTLADFVRGCGFGGDVTTGREGSRAVEAGVGAEKLQPAGGVSGGELVQE